MVTRDENPGTSTTKARAKAKKRRTKRSTPIAGPSEEFVYGGSLLLGVIHGRAGVFRAVTASGKTLGRYKTSRAAMAAITAAARPSAVANPIDVDNSGETARSPPP